MDCVSGRNRRSGSIAKIGHVEQAFVEHVFGAAVALLARLKHKQHASRQVCFALAQHARRARQHCHVRVVAAGVHAILYIRCKIESGVFGHR